MNAHCGARFGTAAGVCRLCSSACFLTRVPVTETCDATEIVLALALDSLSKPEINDLFSIGIGRYV